MNHSGYICTITNLRKHYNADRLQITELFGCNVIVDLNVQVGDRGVFFPSGLRLSDEFCKANDLVRRKDEEGRDAGGFLEPGKQNIKALKLRGEVSDGLWLPLKSLENFTDISSLKDGDEIEVLNGVEICCKYVPRNTKIAGNPNSKRSKKHRNKKLKFFYNFPEHIDTPQLMYCLNNFKPGDLITITEKLEGTSGRSALVPVYKNSLLRKLFGLKPKKTYKAFCGSRRVCINEEQELNPGFYGSNEFRMDIHNRIATKLTPNMEVFYEIVGWTGEGGVPIMGEVDTKCLKDKAFSHIYGDKMIFSYGCKPGTYDFYIYRITQMDDDGNIMVEYSTDQIAAWCELNGFKMVPVLRRVVIADPAEVEELAHRYCDGESTLAHHWREGCVMRRENNAFKFDVYKHKNNSYKIMRGMATEKLAETNTAILDNDLLEELS